MAAQTQDDDDDVLDDASEPKPTGVYGTAAAPPPEEQADPSQYTDNQKMGMAAIAMLTPLLGGLIGGRTGALAGAAGAGQGIGAQVQSDTNFERQQALYGQRYGRQNKLGYEVRRQMVDGVPQDVVFDRVTGQWKTPDGKIAYTAKGEENAVPGGATPAAAASDAGAAPPAAAAQASAPVPTDPVSQRLAELEDLMPSDDDLNPARQEGESLAQARSRVQQAQATKAHVLTEQGKLKDAVALGKGPKPAAAAADDSDDSGDAPPAKPATPAAPPAADPKTVAEFQKMGKDLTGGTASSRTDFGKNQATITNAGKILALGEQGKHQPGGLDARQIHEIAISTGNLLSGGNAAAQATVQALVPSSVGTAPAKIEEWLTSDPQGTGQQEFVNRMMETAQREQFVAQENIKGIKSDVFQTYSDLADKSPQRFKALKDYHLGPNAKFDAQGHYLPQQFHPPPSDPQDQAAMKWLQDNPDDEGAAGVRARLQKRGLL